MNSWKEQGYMISTNKDQLDLDIITKFLSEESYWAKGRSRETVEKSIDNSILCFGIYKQNEDGEDKQVGFARVISDLATFAYLCDVFVLPSYRGKGLSKWLIDVITNHPSLKAVRRLLLITQDAHGLYAKYGFELIEYPERFMQKMTNK